LTGNRATLQSDGRPFEEVSAERVSVPAVEASDAASKT
jgi:hypothetical protein